MSKAIRLLILTILSTTAVYCQNHINTPYSRYGIGDLLNSGFAYNKAFGGSSAGLRPKNQINYLNPASFTSQDTLSFLLQTGLGVQFNNLSNDVTSINQNNMSIQYFVIGFPIKSWLKASVGLVPYSRVGYQFKQDGATDDTYSLDQTYSGDGGFNEFYFGASTELFNMLSIGASANYFFGSYAHERNAIVNGANSAKLNLKDELICSDFFFRLGLQVYPNISENHKLTFGAAYENETDISSKINRIYFYDYPGITTNYFQNVSDSGASITLPSKLTTGLSYVYKNRLTATAEYSMQDWSDQENLTKYSSIRGGIAYRHKSIHERIRASYFEHIEFRLGGHYTNTYLNITNDLGSEDITDMGVSFGIGLPWKNYRKVFTGTAFNLTYQYGIRGTSDINLIKETYHNISIGIVLHDFWFIKSKYD